MACRLLGLLGALGLEQCAQSPSTDFASTSNPSQRGMGGSDGGNLDVSPLELPPESPADAAASSSPGPGDGPLDGSAPDGGADSAVPSTPAPSIPASLSEAGLYADIRQKTLAAGLRPFTPNFPLWTDGAEKHRWILLPEGSTIDSSTMDQWSFPVGTKAFKEFAVDGKRIETRMIHRYGPGPKDFLFAAYAWNEDETEAVHVPSGVTGARGTRHAIPPSSFCKGCHEYLPSRFLGFSAVQLSDGAPLSSTALFAEKRLSTVPRKLGEPFAKGAARDALGYLHGNCSHCHNPTGIPFKTPFSLLLSVDDTSIATTAAMRTAVNVKAERFNHPGLGYRVQPGNPTDSALLYRMRIRDTAEQMPPIGSARIDPSGIDAVQTWIAELPK